MDEASALLEVKNYRCFSDGAPLLLPLKTSPVALVGPNNSGKSSAIRLIHELQPLWTIVPSTNAAILNSMPTGMSQLRNVPDNADVFYNGNTRDITIRLTIERRHELRPDELASIEFSVGRSSGSVVAFAALRDGTRVGHIRGFDPKQGRLVLDDEAVVDGSVALKFLETLARAQYVPPHRAIVNAGGADPYGLPSGAHFVSRWRSLKGGISKAGTAAAIEVEELVATIFGFESLQINATEQNDLQLVVDRKAYRLEELGHGIAQFILALVNLRLTRPSLVLLDEPEIGLHPALQIKYLSQIGEITGGNVYFATHSIGLARAFAPDIIALRRSDGASLARRFETVQNYPEFVGELSFSTWRDMGARAVLLVEGVTDVPAVVTLLRKLRKELEVVVLPMGGRELIKKGTAHEIAELLRLNTKVCVLIDSERSSANAPLTRQRDEFVHECANVPVEIHVLERRALENYWPDRAVKEAKHTGARELAHYEDVRVANCGWGKSDNWLIASKTTPDQLRETDLWRFLEQI